MKACVLYLPDWAQSRTWAQRARDFLTQHDYDVLMQPGVAPDVALKRVVQERRQPYPLDFQDPVRQQRYYDNLLNPAVMGSFYAHYDAWEICARGNEPMMIFEDDVIFYRDYQPVEFDEVLILVMQDRIRSRDQLFENKMRQKQHWRQHYLEDPQGAPQAIPLESQWQHALGTAAGYLLHHRAAQKLLDTFAAHYTAADRCIGPGFVRTHVHSYLMGRAATEQDGKVGEVTTWMQPSTQQTRMRYQ